MLVHSVTVAKLVLFGKGTFMLHGKSQQNLRSMVLCAMLLAVSVLLTRFVSPQMGDAVRFSFGTIPIMLAGIVCGPVYGLVVGLTADLLGFFINPMGAAFLPGLTLCSGLLGLVPALLYVKLFKSKNVIWLIVAVTLSELVISGLIKSYFLMGYYGGTYWVWAGPKLINAIVMAIIEIPVLKLLLKILEKKSK